MTIRNGARRATALTLLASTLLLSGCADKTPAQTPASSVVTKVVTVQPPSSSAPKTTATSVVHTAKPTTTSGGSDGSFTMPNEVGHVLQNAQDDIQRVSGDPVFFSHSHDALGDRFQILDEDWKVCAQNVAPGQRVSAVGHIDFSAVKLSESCP